MNGQTKYDYPPQPSQVTGDFLNTPCTRSLRVWLFLLEQTGWQETIKRMKKLGGYFVLRKQGLTEKLRGKCLGVSGILCKFAEKKNN